MQSMNDIKDEPWTASKKQASEQFVTLYKYLAGDEDRFMEYFRTSKQSFQLLLITLTSALNHRQNLSHQLNVTKDFRCVLVQRLEMGLGTKVQFTKIGLQKTKTEKL